MGAPRASAWLPSDANLVSGFLDEILDPARPTEGDFADAAWVQEVINAVERSFRERRWVGLPLDAPSS